MTTNPSAKTILCYGDSNTWGQTPDKTGNRYPVGVRWTSVFQAEMGEGYSVIEEGLSSRTTDIDYARKTGRNGRTYLEPCLDSHAPLDCVVLMLGTNDFKIEFDRTVEDIAAAIGGLVELIIAKTAHYNGTPAKVLIVNPILIDEHMPKLQEWYGAYYNAESAAKSRQLGALLAQVAADTGCAFFDAADVARAGQDGVHIDQASHPLLGKAIAAALKEL